MTAMIEPETRPGPDPIVMRVAPPEDQSRVTIFFRILLVIPHLVVLYLFSIVAQLAGIVGWVAALFLGRLPTPIHRFICSWLRTATQVSGYVWLLTGRWPPLLALDTYDIDVECQEQQRLNRLAVLFRFLLAVPAAIVMFVTILGYAFFTFVFWLIALVKGRLPDSAHLASTAVLRYYTRYNAYVWLLTPAYPNGLFGDGSVRPPMPDEAEVPADSRTLRLTQGAKRLVTAFVIVGVLAGVGGTALAIATGDFGTIAARGQLVTAWNDFSNDVDSFQRDMSACSQLPDPLPCAKGQMATVADEVQRLYDRVSVISFPASAEDEAAALLAAAVAFRDASNQLATAPTAEEYQARAAGTGIETLGQQLDSAYMAAVEALE